MVSPEQLIRMRKEYCGQALDISNSPDDPFTQFTQWFHEALESRITEPNAMVVSTANSAGKPSVRTVLLKIFDTRGFVFFTNYNSHKGSDIKENPFGELLFLWLELERQVRIFGKIERTNKDESDLYFSSRPYLARISAVASPQSSPIENDSELKSKIELLKKQFPEGSQIPRPDHWGGFRVIPEKFEFWQGRPDRLHSRLCYKKKKNEWGKTLLAP